MARRDSVAHNRFNLSRRGALAGMSGAGAAMVGAPVFAQQRPPAGVDWYGQPRKLSDVDHAIVYRREDEFTGWPHVMGFWNFGDGEILQQVQSIVTEYENPDAISHDNIGRGSGGEVKMVALRSRDYGRSWDGDDPTLGIMRNIDPAMAGAKTMGDLQPLDFLNNDTIIANSGAGFGSPNATTDVRISRNRGKSWSPAIPVPKDALHSIAGMNSSLIRPDGTALIWLMEVGESGWDRHPCVYALPPKGTDFHFLTFVTPKADPKGAADGDYTSTFRFGGHRWFYPRGYMLPSGRMLCVLRCQRDPRGIMWTEVHASDDGGRTWGFLSRVNDFGAPGSLVVMPDGRLVMVYGYRLMPSGIRARVSEDGGQSWGQELIIRDDGGSWDLGYPNAWVTDDGKVGVLYYFNSKDDPVQVNGGKRHIMRSIFSID